MIDNCNAAPTEKNTGSLRFPPNSAACVLSANTAILKSLHPDFFIGVEKILMVLSYFLQSVNPEEPSGLPGVAFKWSLKSEQKPAIRHPCLFIHVFYLWRRFFTSCFLLIALCVDVKSDWLIAQEYFHTIHRCIWCFELSWFSVDLSCRHTFIL